METGKEQANPVSRKAKFIHSLLMVLASWPMSCKT